MRQKFFLSEKSDASRIAARLLANSCHLPRPPPLEKAFIIYHQLLHSNFRTLRKDIFCILWSCHAGVLNNLLSRYEVIKISQLVADQLHNKKGTIAGPSSIIHEHRPRIGALLFVFGHPKRSRENEINPILFVCPCHTQNGLCSSW